jgi:hypothetical protein
MQHREIFRRTLGAIEWGLIAHTVIVVFFLAILFRLLCCSDGDDAVPE